MAQQIIEIEDTRLDRAQELVARGKVYRAHGYDWLYVVTNGGGQAYAIDVDRMSCTCPDMTHRGGDPVLHECKHLLAVRIARGETVQYPKPTAKIRLQDLYAGVA